MLQGESDLGYFLNVRRDFTVLVCYVCEQSWAVVLRRLIMGRSTSCGIFYNPEGTNTRLHNVATHAVFYNKNTVERLKQSVEDNYEKKLPL